MRKIFSGALFFTGWMLSPFTWWNDILVNIPLSYLIANIIYYSTGLPFKWLVLSSYWLTNVLGLFLMYVGGKETVAYSKKRIRVTLILIAAMAVYSIIMIYLDHAGKLHPIGVYLGKIF